jgi:DNA-directed RNA polymerase specialized sigma24 family protein
MSTSIAALYTAHHTALIRMLTRVVGDADTAEDVYQDAFVAALGAAPDPGSGADLVPWLYQKAQQLGQEARYNRREPHLVPLSACRRVEAPTQWVGETAPEATILGDLRPCWRAALILQALGYTRADTAVFLCCTAKDVRNYLASARRFLGVYGIVAPGRGRPPGALLATLPRHAQHSEYGVTPLKEACTGAAQ